MSDASKEKERHLKRYFTWNPNADRVQDELFQQSEFFDPCDLMLVKYEMLRRVRMDGVSVVQAAAAFGFSRSAFYKAETAWSEGGMVGLLPSRPGPRGGHKLTDEVLDFIETVHAREEGVSTSQLVDRIEDVFDVRVHRRSLERARKRWEKKE